MEYTPLAKFTKSFRLLLILPGGDEDSIRCELSQDDLTFKDCRKYETISYCWGDSTRQEMVTVNESSVLVPSSAVLSLRRIRLQDQARCVWIDSICINQKDVTERGSQVSIMHDIYRNGDRNLIYLCEESHEAAIKSIDAILEEIYSEPDSLNRLRSDSGAWQYSDSGGIKVEYDVESLLHFYSIPWFQRLWVVQEATLATTNICFCGSNMVDLLSITRVAAWLIYNWYFVDAKLRLQCSYAADMNDLVDGTYGYHGRKLGEPATNYYLLDLAQQRLSTHPVDKMYSILGLTKDTLQIPIDYHRQCSEVFRDAAWCMIKSEYKLQILDYVRHWTKDGKLDLEGFASWVPKWHRNKDPDEHPHFLSLIFDASAGRKAILDNGETISSDILRVRGIQIGKVRKTTSRFSVPEEELPERRTTLVELLSKAEVLVSDADFDAHQHSTAKLDTSTAMALAECMVAGVDMRFKPTTPAILQSYESLRYHEKQQSQPAANTETNGNQGSAFDLASEYATSMWNANMNRAFFTCQSQEDWGPSRTYFGLGPFFVEENDIVAIVYGFQYPIILRPIEVPGQVMDSFEYLFLGVAYVQGIMYGEALDTSNQKHIAKERTFTLR